MFDIIALQFAERNGHWRISRLAVRLAKGNLEMFILHARREQNT